MIGSTYSTSHNACILHLVGGPYDGESGLFDHNGFQSIQISNAEEKKTYVYKKRGGSRDPSTTYYLDDVNCWCD